MKITCSILVWWLCWITPVFAEKPYYIIPEKKELLVSEYLNPEHPSPGSALNCLEIPNIYIQEDCLIAVIYSDDLNSSCHLFIQKEQYKALSSFKKSLHFIIIESPEQLQPNFKNCIYDYIDELKNRSAETENIWELYRPSKDRVIAGRFTRDSVRTILFIFAIICVFPFILNVLSKEKIVYLLLLFTIVVTAAGMRLYLTKSCILASWDYNRQFEFESIVNGFFALGLWQFQYQVGYWDLCFAMNMIYGTLTVLLVYVHVKLWMGNSVIALYTSVLLAFLPTHIKFSNSNVQFIPSMFWTTLCFIAIHYIARKSTVFGKLYAFSVFLAMFYLNFFTRFLNIMFFPLYISVILLLYSEEIKRKQIYRFLFIVYVILGVFLTYEYLLRNDVSVVREAPGILNMLTSILRPSVNSFLNVKLSPPWIVILAIWGAIALYSINKRWFLLLLIWYLLFFYTHSIVRMHPLGQARYSLHMTSPLLILVAVGIYNLPYRRLYQGFVIGLVILSPVMYYHFLADYDYTRTLEFLFLRDQIKRIPEGSTLVETDVLWPGNSEGRLKTFSIYFDFYKQRMAHKYKIILYREPANIAGIREGYYYQGTLCSTWDPGKFGMNPRCEEIVEILKLEIIADKTFINRHYNLKFFHGIDHRESFPINLALYRILGRKSQ